MNHSFLLRMAMTCMLSASFVHAESARGSNDDWTGKGTPLMVGAEATVPAEPTPISCTSNSDCSSLLVPGDTSYCTALCIKPANARTGTCAPTGRTLCAAGTRGAGRCVNSAEECGCAQSCGPCMTCDASGQCQPMRENGSSGEEYTLRECKSGHRCLLQNEECPEKCRSSNSECSACQRCIRVDGRLRCDQPDYLQDSPCKSGSCVGSTTCPETCASPSRYGHKAYCDSCTEECFFTGSARECRPATPAHLRCADGRCVKAEEAPANCYPK